MKIKIIVLVFLMILISGSKFLSAQKMIIVERPGTIKNFKYKKGNKIYCKINNTKLLFGTISKVSDSSFCLNKNIEVKIKEISVIFKLRGFFYRSYPKIRLAGFGFLLANTINRTIHNQEGVFDKSGLISGFSIIGFSYVMQALAFRKQVIGEKWRIKIIDLSL